MPVRCFLSQSQWSKLLSSLIADCLACSTDHKAQFEGSAQNHKPVEQTKGCIARSQTMGVFQATQSGNEQADLGFHHF